MGRPLILDRKLVKRIADKVGKPELLVVKSVSALASRKNISSEVALIIVARKYKLGVSSALRKLDPHKQAQLSSELNKNSNMVSPIEATKASKKTIKTIQEISGDFSDPYLSDSIYQGIPSEGYSIMFVLENSIRLFITRAFSSVYGSNWWDQVPDKKSLKSVVTKVSERKTKDSENWYHSKRGVHEIYYTDYTELLQIIRVFDSIFSKFFKKGAAKNLVGKLEELGPTRNVIAHNNPITPKDLERLKVHTRDWFAYMQHLKSQDS
jgi:hypothetical protein